MAGSKPKDSAAYDDGKEEVWYYRQVPYMSGSNKGKLHYQYNWTGLPREVDKALDWFQRRRIKPTIRQIHYYFTQLKPPRIPNVKKCYQKLDEFITELREQGHIAWGHIQGDQRVTENNYPDYWHPKEFVYNKIEKLKDSAEDYYFPKWYKQPNYVELYVENIATVSTFTSLTEHWEINVCHDKGFGSPEAVYQNCKEIVRIMYMEDMQKDVTIFYDGDMDPSGDSMDQVLQNQLTFLLIMTLDLRT
jgi:hypothetical protein